jgi:biofilm PGA synthesis N-glycosyltransferase PgaC
VTQARIPIAVGVTVYNEEKNLDALLEALSQSEENHIVLRQIIIVSSGSTDRSVAIAEAWARRDARFELTNDEVRRGKATAVNQVLARIQEGIGVCVLVGGDLLPHPGALDALVAPFEDASTGMTGAHPVPINRSEGWVNRVVHLQWQLHDALARKRPKMGELVAFRADVPPLDPETVVDEAWLETVAKSRNQRLCYVPEAIVWNRGPTSAAELIDQRRRVFCGHLWLRQSRGYEVSTFRSSSLLALAAAHCAAAPTELPTTLIAGCVELVGRTLGALDYLRGRRPYVWKMATTSKERITHPAHDDGPQHNATK